MDNLNGNVDANVVEGLRVHIELRRNRMRELEQELQSIKPELVRYEKALALILNEQPEPKPRARKSYTPGTSVGPERLDRIRQTILTYAAEHEEFRQVDIRAETGEKSSALSFAFEQLRQENFIRFARKQGNNKFYRLTRTATNVQS